MRQDTDNAHFGELRSLLQRAPSEGVWSRLCRVIEAWGRAEFEARALPYVRDHLKRWPDHLRRAPQRWADDLLRGQGDVWPWSITRTLELRSVPLDELVELEDQPAEGDRALELLLQTEALYSVTHLMLTDLGITDEGCARLLEYPGISRLRSLRLQGNHLGAEGVSRIARTKALSELVALDLRANHWGGYEEAIAQLAHSRALRGLESLDIECDLTPQDLEALLTTSNFPELRHLGLEGCFHQVAIEADEFSELHAGMLNRAITLPRLTSMSLANNMLTDVEVEEIIASPWVERLTELDLAWNDLEDHGVGALTQCDALADLTSLSLRGCPVGEQGAQELARAVFEEIRTLDVSSTRGVVSMNGREVTSSLLSQDAPRRYWLDALTDPAVRLRRLREINLSDLNLMLDASDIARMESVTHLTSLETLQLANAGLTEEGVDALLTSTEFAHLTQLNLNRNHDLGSALADALGRLELPALRKLKLRECGLTDADIARLADAPCLARLEVLDLRNNDLSAEAIDALLTTEALKLCHVIA